MAIKTITVHEHSGMKRTIKNPTPDQVAQIAADTQKGKYAAYTADGRTYKK